MTTTTPSLAHRGLRIGALVMVTSEKNPNWYRIRAFHSPGAIWTAESVTLMPVDASTGQVIEERQSRREYLGNITRVDADPKAVPMPKKKMKGLKFDGISLFFKTRKAPAGKNLLVITVHTPWTDTSFHLSYDEVTKLHKKLGKWLEEN